MNALPDTRYQAIGLFWLLACIILYILLFIGIPFHSHLVRLLAKYHEIAISQAVHYLAVTAVHDSAQHWLRTDYHPSLYLWEWYLSLSLHRIRLENSLLLLPSPNSSSVCVGVCLLWHLVQLMCSPSMLCTNDTIPLTHVLSIAILAL